MGAQTVARDRQKTLGEVTNSQTNQTDQSACKLATSPLLYLEQVKKRLVVSWPCDKEPLPGSRDFAPRPEEPCHAWHC